MEEIITMQSFKGRSDDLDLAITFAESDAKDFLEKMGRESIVSIQRETLLDTTAASPEFVHLIHIICAV